MLIYVCGEGGTGKSQIVKALIAVLTLLNRHHEIMVTAPTGSAADNIDGNTYHTALGLSFGKRISKVAN
jgi:CO dehydrogenase nickel-insertion accessory protein CooC1